MVLQTADDDLEHIGDFIARDNPERAFSFVRELRFACQRLSDAPYGYQLVERYREAEIRRRPTGRYLIFYKVFEDRIEVLRILHGRRDHETELFGSDET
ncbi:type II toxin-antitoxin system RelE/ParE family toxin [Bosea caraganae]|uniref:Type II toxin-antitoxin system RelE/ParE family toxin n=1 Tax=Bosea caraganae TaxID=2763117 RepID=A0A370L4K1_9HYPH|nr:type II toxin-antitoxin system RelE/ParE family toxin [Bosea caraganae]RDJ23810.1 type II toxin-antitoxin system RelE/ParE family toxin [Bosea caraganae]